MNKSYIEITEIPNENIPLEQLNRIQRRYSWVTSYSKNKSVLECSCGSGQGGSMIQEVSSKYIGGDIDEKLISICRTNHPDVSFQVFDACKLPYEDSSFDIIFIFEAIYYLSNFEEFIGEAKRVLKKGGMIFITTANKDLYDFTKSKFSTRYYSVNEIYNILLKFNFGDIEAFGDVSVNNVSLRQKFLRPFKYIFSKLNLVPGSMKNKLTLKKFFYGKTNEVMPKKLNYDKNLVNDLSKISVKKINKEFKTIYIKATL